MAFQTAQCPLSPCGRVTSSKTANVTEIDPWISALKQLGHKIGHSLYAAVLLIRTRPCAIKPDVVSDRVSPTTLRFYILLVLPRVLDKPALVGSRPFARGIS